MPQQLLQMSVQQALKSVSKTSGEGYNLDIENEWEIWEIWNK